jgi:hypothetical protein
MLCIHYLSKYCNVVLTGCNIYPPLQLHLSCILWLNITKNNEVWAWSCTLKGGYLFNTHFWAGLSDCWGVSLLADVNRRLELMFRSSLFAHLKLCNRVTLFFLTFENNWVKFRIWLGKKQYFWLTYSTQKPWMVSFF